MLRTLPLLLLLIAPPLMAKPNPAARVVKTDKQWRQQLTPEQYQVLRKAATEAPNTGAYLHNHQAGTYYCAGCNNKLFEANSKFDSGCGWPAFYTVAAEDQVRLIQDNSHGMQRIEVRCTRCDGHLGHVFDDGPAPTGKRYCINSVALKFIPKSKSKP